MRSYDLKKLAIKELGSKDGQWEMTGIPLTGKIHYYTVTDKNYRDRNEWMFVVRVPKGRGAKHGTQVQPEETPERPVWEGIERRSITFIPAENGVHRGKVYCKIFLQDPAGRRTKIGTRRGERTGFPEWMSPLRHRMRLKSTVKDTRGTDGNSQVIVLLAQDHMRMIWAFFATKVWVQAESFKLTR